MGRCKNCSNDTPDSCMEKYTIQPGDTLSALAQKFQVSYCSLANANPSIINPHVLEPGQEICIPGGAFTLILSSTQEAPNSMGMASVKMNPSEIAIVGLNLPEPSVYGSDYTGFQAKITDYDSGEQISIEMEKISEGIWIGKSKGDLLLDFQEIYITPIGEREAEAAACGPKVLRGRMVKCLMLQR